MKPSRRFLVATLLLVTLVSPALPCTLCVANLRRLPTMRLETNQDFARLVMYGRIVDSALDGRQLGKGSSKFRIETIFKKDPTLPKEFQYKVGDVITVKRYIPVPDKKDPPRYLIFSDVQEKDLDPYRGVPVTSNDAVAYLNKALAFKKEQRSAMLLHFFAHLESDDPQVSLDAFLEFAKADDREVGELTSRLTDKDKLKIRGWIKNEKTPPERIGLYCFLLGACGEDKDAELLSSLLTKPDERARKAYDGILSGYIKLRPKEGWHFALRSLADGKVSVSLRLSIHRALRFYHGWQPEKTKPQVLEGLRLMLEEGELADLAVEDLRQWKWWSLTDKVLARYGTKGFDAPIIKRAIIRYALTCPIKEAKEFVKKVSRYEPDLVDEVRQGLELER